MYASIALLAPRPVRQFLRRAAARFLCAFDGCRQGRESTLITARSFL